MGQASDPGVKMILDAPKNATYLSPEIQNEILDIIAKKIISRIVDEINNAKMFTIMADETSSANREFMSIVIRYVDENETVKEVFIEFCELVGTTGKEVADALLDSLKSYNLDINQIVTQGYDGASNMSSGDKGVHGRIKEIVPTAEYFWCAAHRLNLVATDAAADLWIAQTLRFIKEIINYLNSSVKRASMLKTLVEDLMPESKKRKLMNICPTRWVERHEALLAFKELLVPVTSALPLLSESEPDFTPSALLSSISNFHSIFVLVLTCDIANDLKNISRYLQWEDCDLIIAYVEIQTAMESLSSRMESQEEFSPMYEECLGLSSSLGICEDLPRTVSRSTKFSSTRNYFQFKVYEPYLKNIVNELQRHFSDTQKRAFVIQKLLPVHIMSENEPDLLNPEILHEIIDFYHNFVDDISFNDFNSELRRWKVKWYNVAKPQCPITICETLKAITDTKDFYSTIYKLLKLLLTLPVTTATPERTFSTLARLFMERRRSMTTKRLSNLAVLSFHFEKASAIDADDILSLFSATTRRIKLK